MSCIVCTTTEKEAFSSSQYRKPATLARACNVCLKIPVEEGKIPAELEATIGLAALSSSWTFAGLDMRR